MPDFFEAGAAPSARIATPDDVPALVDLINKAYIAEADIVRGSRTDLDDVRTKMSAANTWFLVLDSPESQATLQLLGCVCLHCDGQRGHVGLLSVHPSMQGHGLGRLLLGAAERHCHQHMCCPLIELDVVNLRSDLFPFYEKMGFVRTGVLPFPDEPRLLRPAHLVTMQKHSRVPPNAQSAQ